MLCSTRCIASIAFTLSLAAAASSEEAAGAKPSAKRPNVLLYVVDTLRADGLAGYGNPTVRTPVADRLASEGTLYENAFATSSWTRASIASILSGLHPDVHGVETRQDVLSDRVELLSEHFQAKGYETAAVVANPNIGSFYGFEQGFDAYFELYERRERGMVYSKESIVPSDQVVRNAAAWLERSGRPFFLFVLAIDPHWPYTPPPEFDRYRGDYRGRVDEDEFAVIRTDLSPRDQERIRGLYYGEIDFTDAYLGELLDVLKKKGEVDDTIVVLTSDHGESFWENGRVLHGQHLHQETAHVPLILRYPPSVEAGRRVERPVVLVDIAPTLLELADLPIPPGLDGRSLARAPEGGDRALYSTLDLDDLRLKAITRYPWKLIRNGDNGARALFDLAHDPLETRNLIGEQPKRAVALEAELDARIAANAKRRAALVRDAPAQKLPDSELPDEAREALEALGYIEPASE